MVRVLAAVSSQKILFRKLGQQINDMRLGEAVRQRKVRHRGQAI